MELGLASSSSSSIAPKSAQRCCKSEMALQLSSVGIAKRGDSCPGVANCHPIRGRISVRVRVRVRVRIWGVLQEVLDDCQHPACVLPLIFLGRQPVADVRSGVAGAVGGVLDEFELLEYFLSRGDMGETGAIVSTATPQEWWLL